MRWLVVARREGRDVARSRALRALVALFVLVGIAAVAVPATAFDGRLPADRALAFLVAPLKLVGGLAGLLAGQGAIAAPRTGGQLKLTLGLPIPRTALVLGAFLGRAVVVLAGTAAGILAVSMAIVVVHGTLPTVVRLRGAVHAARERVADHLRAGHAYGSGAELRGFLRPSRSLQDVRAAVGDLGVTVEADEPTAVDLFEHLASVESG